MSVNSMAADLQRRALSGTDSEAERLLRRLQAAIGSGDLSLIHRDARAARAAGAVLGLRCTR